MMDLRTRSLKEVNNSSSTASKRRAMSAASSPSSGELAAMGVGQQQKLGLWLRLKRETWLMGAAALRLVKGQGSSLAYLLIPAFISLLWLLVCMLTTKAPSLTLEERFAQKHLRVSKAFYPYAQSMHNSMHISIHIIFYKIYTVCSFSCVSVCSQWAAIVWIQTNSGTE